MIIRFRIDEIALAPEAGGAVGEAFGDVEVAAVGDLVGGDPAVVDGVGVLGLGARRQDAQGRDEEGEE